MMRLAILLLAGILSLQAQGSVPRKAPELQIAEASGKTKLLSSYRGRVVLLAFISTECPHCQKVSGVFEHLSREFGSVVQVAEVAFNERADTAAFAKRFGLSFPIGLNTADAAHDFLGIPRGMRLGTPQIVAIDRKGQIRAQSERLGSPMLQTSEYLRALLQALLGLR